MKPDLTGWVKMALAGGRYQVTAALGQGGMGTVFRARDRNLDTDVVIKVPHPELLQDAEFAARFAVEIRALVKLAHPHIVRVIDVGHHAGLPFVVLQYLPGGSLEDRIPRDRQGRFVPLPPQELAGWLPEAAEALDFIHAQGYVHRDVKPANLLFDGHGNLFLSDFGIAKAVSSGTASRCGSLTGTGMVVGTPQYMAPELILGQPCRGAADQYALAVLVFEMLAGRPPFEDSTAPALFVAHSTRPAPPLGELVPALPRSVTDAVNHALAKDPARRHPSCAAFAQAVLDTRLASARLAQVPARRTRAVAAPAPPGAALPTAVRQGRTLTCPRCGESVPVHGNKAGKRMRCFACDALFALPTGEKSPGRPAEPRAETSRTPQARIDTERHSRSQAAPAPTAASPEDNPPMPGRQWRRVVIAGTAALLLAAVGLAWVLWPAQTPEPFQLSLASPELVLQGGGRGEVEILLDRKGHAGPARLSVEGLPGGVTAGPDALAADRDRATLTLAADASAEPGQRQVRVVVALGGLRQERTLRLTVRPSPAVPENRPTSPTEDAPKVAVTPPASRPADLPRITVNPLSPLVMEAGTERAIDLGVERHNCDGPLRVEVEAAAGILCPPVALKAGEDRAALRLKVLEDAADGGRSLRVLVRSDGVPVGEATLALTVKTPPSIKLEAERNNLYVRLGGETRVLEVRFQRRGFQGRVQVRLEGLPAGVSLKPLPTAADPPEGRVVEADRDVVGLVLAADSKAVVGEHSFRLVARAGQVETTETFSLVVAKPEPEASVKPPSPRAPMPKLPFLERLQLPVNLPDTGEARSFKEWCEYFETRYDISIAIRLELFRRRGLEDMPVRLTKQKDVPLIDVLEKLAAQVNGRCRKKLDTETIEIVPR